MAATFPVRLGKAILSGFSNQPRCDGVTTPGVTGMYEAAHGRKDESTKDDDGSAMIMQRDNDSCATGIGISYGLMMVEGFSMTTSPSSSYRLSEGGNTQRARLL